MTLSIVVGAFLSPCCMTCESCSPMCVTMVLCLTESGWILMLWYQSVRSSFVLNFLAAVQFRISLIFGNGVGSEIVTSFLDMQSIRNIGSTLFAFGLGKKNTQFVNYDSSSLPVFSSWFTFFVIWCLNLCSSHVFFRCHVLPGMTLM